MKKMNSKLGIFRLRGAAVCRLALVAAAGSCLVWGGGFRAGVAAIDITPAGPIRLSGYAARTHPSVGVIHPIYTKSLAIEDGHGHRIVLVTADVVGLPRAITDVVAARLEKRYGLRRSEIWFNASHTHTAPVIWPNLSTMYDLPPDQLQVVKQYGRKLTEQLVTVAGTALGRLAPAKLAYGSTTAGFAVNRRAPGPTGIHIGVNPNGPVDHTVPVLKVTGQDGKLRAVVFGYSCHNTTLTGQFYKISGDYAGFAQSDIEQGHPGAEALFVQLCGGDQNPNPRGHLQDAIDHGRELATAVDGVLSGKMKPIHPRIRTAFQMVDLAFAYHTRETFEKQLHSTNKWEVRRAQAMLKAYDEGHPVRRLAYPVQAIRFGKQLTILTLGGEVVVDYCLRAKREYPKQNLVVSGYSNDVMCYIPSLRVLKEGGYEAVDSMIYYGQPGPFADDVEQRIFHTIHQVMRRVGVKHHR